ncbi:UNVERIFIED_CONTAM: hypothetical protein FKN15_050196 [Acipenser sinensis]
MKCLREKGQGPRIDQYFLRSQSSQSNEIQRQEANHSSQDISTPVIDVRRTCMDTVSDEPNDPCEPGQTNQHKREKNLNGHKPGVKWPRACEKTAWNTVNTDLCFALERLSGTVEKKLDKFGDIIYAYGSGVRSGIAPPGDSERKCSFFVLFLEKKKEKKMELAQEEEDDCWELLLKGLAAELCPGCGAYGHTVAICPTQYDEEELLLQEPEEEEPVCPVSGREEPVCPVSGGEEPVCPVSERRSQCVPCPEGRSQCVLCPEGRSQCVLCLEGRSQCILCPEGRSQCVLCPEERSQYILCLEGRSQCVLCPEGRSQCILCPEGRSQCVLCPEGRSQCVLCPEGRS